MGISLLCCVIEHGHSIGLTDAGGTGGLDGRNDAREGRDDAARADDAVKKHRGRFSGMLLFLLSRNYDAESAE